MAELKRAASIRGATVSGTRTQLIDRLTSADAVQWSAEEIDVVRHDFAGECRFHLPRYRLSSVLATFLALLTNEFVDHRNR